MTPLLRIEAAIWRQFPPRTYKRLRQFRYDLRAAWRMLFTRSGRAFRREYGLFLWPRKVRIRTRADFGQLYDRVHGPMRARARDFARQEIAKIAGRR